MFRRRFKFIDYITVYVRKVRKNANIVSYMIAALEYVWQRMQSGSEMQSGREPDGQYTISSFNLEALVFFSHT